MENYNKELCDERHARTQETLDKHEHKIEKLEKCTSRLEPEVKLQHEQCERSMKAINKMQKKPADIIGKAITHAISVLAGALAIWILQLLGIS